MDSNLFWCIIGIVGGTVASLLISVAFYIIGKKQKKLYYDIETSCIVSDEINEIENLKLSYNDKEINNLYSTTITLNNVCKQTIDENDFSKYEPLSVYTDGEFIIYENSNELTPIYDDNKTKCYKIIINFDYIPQKDEPLKKTL